MGRLRGQVYRRVRTGFTLWELLVVVGVLVLLMGLVATFAGKSWKAARRTNCMSNMRQVSAAYFQYAAENDGRLPLCDLDQVVLGRSFDALKDISYLRPYIGDRRVYHCPEDLRTDVRTYAVNDYFGGQFLSITHAPLLQRVVNMPMTMLLIEEQSPPLKNSYAGGFVILPAPSTAWADNPGVLHEGGTCLSFADGHVEYWKWLDKRTLTLPLTAFPHTKDNPDLVRLQGVAGSSLATVN